MKKIVAFVVALMMIVPMLGTAALAEEEFLINEDTPIVRAYFTGDNTANEWDSIPDYTMAIDTRVMGEDAIDSYVRMGATWQLGNEPRISIGLVGKRVHEDVENVPENEPETVAIVGVKAELEKDSYEIKEDDEGELQMYRASTPETIFSGKNNWFSLSEDESFLEFGIQMQAAPVHTADDGRMYVKLKLTVSLENGETEVFDGAIVLETTWVVYSNAISGEILSPNVAHSDREFTNHLFSKYTFDSENGVLTQYFDRKTENSSGYQFYSITDKNGNALFEEGKRGELSFDFRMPDVPYATPKHPEACVEDQFGNDAPLQTQDENGVRAILFVGIGSGELLGGWTPSGKVTLVFSIYNSEDGLKLYYDAGADWENHCVELGVSSEEFFKLTLQWKAFDGGYKATVLVNNDPVGTLELPEEKFVDFPIYRGNGVAVGFATDETDNSAVEQSFCYRNIAISVEGSKMNNKINSLLDNYGYVAPAPLPPQPPAGGDDEENGDGDGDVGATTTARPSGNVTNAPATSEAPQGATDDAPKKKGCKSSVGVVAVLVLGVSGAAVMLKKKDD